LKSEAAALNQAAEMAVAKCEELQYQLNELRSVTTPAPGDSNHDNKHNNGNSDNGGMPHSEIGMSGNAALAATSQGGAVRNNNAAAAATYDTNSNGRVSPFAHQPLLGSGRSTPLISTIGGAAGGRTTANETNVGNSLPESSRRNSVIYHGAGVPPTLSSMTATHAGGGTHTNITPSPTNTFGSSSIINSGNNKHSNSYSSGNTGLITQEGNMASRSITEIGRSDSSIGMSSSQSLVAIGSGDDIRGVLNNLHDNQIERERERRDIDITHTSAKSALATAQDNLRQYERQRDPNLLPMAPMLDSRYGASGSKPNDNGGATRSSSNDALALYEHAKRGFLDDLPSSPHNSRTRTVLSTPSTRPPSWMTSTTPTRDGISSSNSNISISAMGSTLSTFPFGRGSDAIAPMQQYIGQLQVELELLRSECTRLRHSVESKERQLIPHSQYSVER
jgi:hypothetical protein